MKKLILSTALIALGHTNIAQAQALDKCVQPEQAEALIAYMLPKAVTAAQSKCSAVLPADSMLMEENSERLAAYKAASEKAWPMAKQAVSVIGGEKLPAEIDDTLLMPLTDAIFTGMITEEIKSKDCALINKIYGDLAPMPSANIASLTVTIIQAATKNDQKNDLPICKMPT